MNCANHPDRERVAFCQNCGKPLCAECVRNVGTSVFCEPCLAARVAAAAPPTPGYRYPSPAGYPPPQPRGPAEPHPGLAALLGLIPGVGAMYNEQYAKGVIHLIVFAFLVSLAHDFFVFHLFIFGWVVYMVIDAHNTARARRDGMPLPDTFGLNDLSEHLASGRAWRSSTPYSRPAPAPNPASADPSSAYPPPVSPWGAPQDTYAGVPPIPPAPPIPPYPDPNLAYSRRFPMGAVWLIALGVLFLVGNTHIFQIFHTRLFGPLLLIGIGVWLFVQRMISTSYGSENSGINDYRWRLSSAVSSSIWIVLVGFVWLLDVFQILPWSRSWPIYLIALGLLGLFKRGMYGDFGPYSPPSDPPVTTTAPVPTAPAQGDDHSADNQVGR
jgi:hypothetical protein